MNTFAHSVNKVRRLHPTQFYDIHFYLTGSQWRSEVRFHHWAIKHEDSVWRRWYLIPNDEDKEALFQVG